MRMSPDWKRLIERIHASSLRGVIAVTGGGVSAIADLLTVPGGSKTVLEAIVPYSSESLTEWLRRKPEHFCSEETALAMGTTAYWRARSLGKDRRETARDVASDVEQKPDFFGVGCTAALVSAHPKRGGHRCFIAVQKATSTTTYSLVLGKGSRDRAGEESLVGQLLMHGLARAAGIDDIPTLELRENENVVVHEALTDPLLVELAQGQRGVVWSTPQVTSTGTLPRGVLCGAFNPLHDGHRELRAAAERHLGGPVCYEMSITNVDKPPIDYLTIDRRRVQFTEHPLVLTNAPTFSAKSLVLPGTVFVVGVDTAERVVQAKYYAVNGDQWLVVSGGSTQDAMRAALGQIRENGCRFLVAGRLAGERFVELKDIAIPPEFADLFEPLPATAFRHDISSTELRLAETNRKAAT